MKRRKKQPSKKDLERHLEEVKIWERDLKEIQDWLNAPGTMEMIEATQYKPTKSEKKMTQYLEDVSRNVHLQKRAKKIKWEHDWVQVNAIYADYRSFLENLLVYRKEYQNKQKGFRERRRLCVRYGLSSHDFDALRLPIDGRTFLQDELPDMCVIEKSTKRYKLLDKHNFHLNIVEAIDDEIYPIHLKIHRFASKRDLLDFVEHNWKRIGRHLIQKRVRVRKTPREIVDFIWYHKDKGTKEIKKLMNERFEFRKDKPAYFEINKILSQEKKRRGLSK